MMHPNLARAFLAAVTFGVVRSAQRHTGVAEAGGVLSGLLHPPSGWDHILALLAVGVWAARSDARMAILGAFNLMVVCGAVAAMRGVALPIVESGIAASVLVLGLLIALAARLPRIAATAIVCVLAVLHGHPHGAEIAAIVNPLSYRREHLAQCLWAALRIVVRQQSVVAGGWRGVRGYRRWDVGGVIMPARPGNVVTIASGPAANRAALEAVKMRLEGRDYVVRGSA